MDRASLNFKELTPMNKEIEKAKLLLKLGKYNQAIKFINDELRNAPYDEKLLCLLSASYIKLNKVKKAREIINIALAEDPNNPTVKYFNSMIDLYEDDGTYSINQIDGIGTIEVESRFQANLKIAHLINSNSIKDSVNYIKKNIENLDLTNSLVNFVLDYNAIFTKEIRIAEKGILKSLERNPEGKFARYNYSLVQYYKGDSPKAIETISSLAKEFPNKIMVTNLYKEILTTQNSKIARINMLLTKIDNSNSNFHKILVFAIVLFPFLVLSFWGYSHSIDWRFGVLAPLTVFMFVYYYIDNITFKYVELLFYKQNEGQTFITQSDYKKSLIICGLQLLGIIVILISPYFRSILLMVTGILFLLMPPFSVIFMEEWNNLDDDD